MHEVHEEAKNANLSCSGIAVTEAVPGLTPACDCHFTRRPTRSGARLSRPGVRSKERNT